MLGLVLQVPLVRAARPSFSTFKDTGLGPSVLSNPFRIFFVSFYTMAKPKLHGRAFYESIGSPKYILAPMVDQSEFAWRMLTRSFMPPDLRASILAYSPMFHAKLFVEAPKYRPQHFQPLKPPLAMPHPSHEAHLQTISEDDAYLDGNPKIDRPLFVQFCANEPAVLLEAAKYVQPYCDAVDLNLGCPQGIAKRGHYGAFLQDDWDTIHTLISTLHKELEIPVTAKIRILETRERTLEYAKMILNAGASIITVHGRRREQKGHNTGLADYSVIRYLREQLPRETVIFANGNILQHSDIQKCLAETGADGVMSAEGNLYDPSIFAPPPTSTEETREYWIGRDGKGGYRVDAVLRRYLDIIYKYVLDRDAPKRGLLFLTSDIQMIPGEQSQESGAVGGKRTAEEASSQGVDVTHPTKRQKLQEVKDAKQNFKQERCQDPNLTAMQAHCFHILRPLVSKHHNVRDALARIRAGNIDAFEYVLKLVEEAVKEGLLAYESNPDLFEENTKTENVENVATNNSESSAEAVKRCKRPYWVCQPYVRPAPIEALKNGSIQLSKKEKKRRAEEEEKRMDARLQGQIEIADKNVSNRVNTGAEEKCDLPASNEGMVCG